MVEYGENLLPTLRSIRNIIAFQTSTPLFLTVQSPNFTVYCDFCLPYLLAVICWGLNRNIPFLFSRFLVFSSSSASDSKELAIGNYFLES